MVENSHTFRGRASNVGKTRSKKSNVKTMQGALPTAEWAPLLRRKLMVSSGNYGSLLTRQRRSAVEPSCDPFRKVVNLYVNVNVLDVSKSQIRHSHRPSKAGGLAVRDFSLRTFQTSCWTVVVTEEPAACTGNRYAGVKE